MKNLIKNFYFQTTLCFFPIDKNKNSPVYYDEKYIYFDKKLSETELIYFKTLLIIFNYIKNKKILNYIDQDKSADLKILKTRNLDKS